MKLKATLLSAAFLASLGLVANAADQMGMGPTAADQVNAMEAPVPAQGPEGRARAGVLACEIAGGIGFIVGSSKSVSCTFDQRGMTETYVGRINKLGLDIGVTGTQYLRWVVFAPSSVDAMEGLAGRYAGVSAQGSLGVGFGANALVGGNDRQIVLQPVSIQAGTGLNVAVGVAALTLDRS